MDGCLRLCLTVCLPACLPVDLRMCPGLSACILSCLVLSGLVLSYLVRGSQRDDLIPAIGCDRWLDGRSPAHERGRQGHTRHPLRPRIRRRACRIAPHPPTHTPTHPHTHTHPPAACSLSLLTACCWPAACQCTQAGSPPSIPGGATLVFDVELISIASATGGVASSGAAAVSSSSGGGGAGVSHHRSGWLLPTPPAESELPNLFRKLDPRQQGQATRSAGVVVVCPCVQPVKAENLIAAGISPLWCRSTDDYNVHHFVAPRF